MNNDDKMWSVHFRTHFPALLFLSITFSCKHLPSGLKSPAGDQISCELLYNQLFELDAFFPLLLRPVNVLLKC